MTQLTPRYIGHVGRDGFVHARTGMGAPPTGYLAVYLNWAGMQASRALQTGSRTYLASGIQYAHTAILMLIKAAPGYQRAMVPLLSGLSQAGKLMSVASGAAILQNVIAQMRPYAAQYQQALPIPNQQFAGLSGLPRARPQPRRGLGAPVGLGTPIGLGDLNTSDATLQSAAQTLLSNLQSSGCQQSSQPDVSAFQTAYNAAGGSPALTVDGLYGVNTAAGLQAAIDGPGPGGSPAATVPAGCVGAASSSSGGSTTPAASTTTPASVNVDASTNSDLVPLALAGVAGAGLIGLAIYAHKKGGIRYVFRRRHRR